MPHNIVNASTTRLTIITLLLRWRSAVLLQQVHIAGNVGQPSIHHPYLGSFLQSKERSV